MIPLNDTQKENDRVTHQVPRITNAKPHTLISQIRMLIQYREMLLLWTRREIRSRYRQSLLGFGWALVQPVFQMIVISVIFGKILHVPSNGFPYPIFAYSALLPWMLFSGSISSAVPCLLSNMNLLTKIYFPREILPLSAILTRCVDFMIGAIVFVVLMIWYGLPAHLTLLYVPLLLLIQIILALGISLLGAAVSVFIRDVSFVVPLALQLWMYASPVIYPISILPEKWRNFYMLNPMAGILDSYRKVILFGEAPNLFYLGLATAFSVGLCIFAYRYFKKLEMAMSDIL